MDAFPLYILDGHLPQRVENVTGWAGWMSKNPEACTVGRKVLRTADGETVVVSTVFLGIDAHRDPFDALLFETRITCPGPLNGTAKRSGTWEKAESTHAEAIGMVMGEFSFPELAPQSEPDPEERERAVQREREALDRGDAEQEQPAGEGQGDGEQEQGDAQQEEDQPADDPSGDAEKPIDEQPQDPF